MIGKSIFDHRNETTDFTEKKLNINFVDIRKIYKTRLAGLKLVM